YGAGTVDEGDALTQELGGGESRLDAHLVGAGCRRVVADGIARRHGVLAWNRARARQDRVEKRCLAARDGTDDGYAFRSLASFSGSGTHDDLTSSHALPHERRPAFGRRVTTTALRPCGARSSSSHGFRARASGRWAGLSLPARAAGRVRAR